MGKLAVRYESFQKALKMLDRGIASFTKIINNIDKFNEQEIILDLYFSDLFLLSRESMIQRFEYCVDLYWKYLKDYLEFESKIVVTPSGPKNIIREATKARLITETESLQSLEMIDDRNQSSHIYREEIAEQISLKIPNYYNLMKKIVDLLQPNE